MDEIVSLVVANGIFAVLFCGLLVFELRDSRAREGKYVSIIRALNERLKTVDDILEDAEQIKQGVESVMSDTEQIKRAVVKSAKKPTGGGECAKLAAV